ncbi:methionyl-tRNA formyltransferase [Galbitalea sp. SE-J8]|uniref:methionyl-tRNA formyltransferase n=1 Tax=Galbitalea sp. SE-J8 TaxID=3054952 RepID=UPI00259CA2E0|nr:methionyl-tRNA formyltransferase [Galbitalea sp. SE-J8]MDM4764036.1 methionyl-tRNA formyltransferase [Galbitalea sp. SE-J8]
MRLLFAGSPAAAVPSLKALIASGHDVAAVLTRADSPQGRKRVLTPTPVAALAEERGIPVLRANRIDEATTRAIADLRPDLGVIVAYGALLREPLLSTPRLGWINLHFSLLPRWRGAAPVQRAIIAGDDVTGAAVFQLVPELDAGDVYGQLTESIGSQQTAGSLLEQLSGSGATLLTRVVDALAVGTARAEPQAGDVTLAPKLTIADGLIDWTTDAASAHARIRGVTPEPGAFALLSGERFKIHRAAIARDVPRPAPGTLAASGGRVLVGTATDPIELLEVQPAGKRPMGAADWWRGRPADAPDAFDPAGAST